MRLLITQSLLSAYSYIWNDFSQFDNKDELEDKSYNDFLQMLRHEETIPSKPMLDGIAFEQLVTDILNGTETAQDNQNWYEAAALIAQELEGGQLQVTASLPVEINDIPFLLYGRLDCLKAGSIYDIKYSKSYEAGKYINSVQHSMYLKLVPEAKRFIYVISNGSRIWRETYTPDECKPIESTIQDFIEYLSITDLWGLYCEKWAALDSTR